MIKYISKSVAVALLLTTVLLYTPEAAVRNSSGLTEAITSFEMDEAGLYKATAPDKKARNAYKRYVKNYLSSRKRFPGHRYKLCDINNDSIPEMFFSYAKGVRAAYKIYTYKKGKIIKKGDFSGCNFITYNRSSKQICVIGSGGASHSILTCYKMVSSKLKQTSEYECISDYSGEGAIGCNTIKITKEYPQKDIINSQKEFSNGPIFRSSMCSHFFSLDRRFQNFP